MVLIACANQTHSLCPIGFCLATEVSRVGLLGDSCSIGDMTDLATLQSGGMVIGSVLPDFVLDERVGLKSTVECRRALISE